MIAAHAARAEGEKPAWGVAPAHGNDPARGPARHELAWLTRRVLRGATAVVANSGFTRDLLLTDWAVPPERVRLRGEIRALQQRLGVTTVMVTHDQEEALSMADRIVVMCTGHIEQVGTPRQVYEAPATPFVADFVGKINVLPAVAEGGGQFRVGEVSLAVARPDIVAGTFVNLYLRPEEIALNAAGGVNGNTLGARIAKVEFLGAFCMVGLTLDAKGAPALVANVPRHDVDSGRMAAGQAVRVSLPPDALRVLG